jgi:hypothetical protein
MIRTIVDAWNVGKGLERRRIAHLAISAEGALRGIMPESLLRCRTYCAVGLTTLQDLLRCRTYYAVELTTS